MLACAAVLILAASPYAYAQAVDLADARSDTTGGAPETLEYESSGLNVTGAELLDFPFLSMSIGFTGDARDRALTIFFADSLFDPVFDPDGYQIDVITDVGLHDAFEMSGRNMTITNLPVGIESIDIYLSARDGVADAVPDDDSSAVEEPNPGVADSDTSGDGAAGDGGGSVQNQVTDAPEDVTDSVGDNDSVDSDVTGGVPSEADGPSDGTDTSGEATPQPPEDGPASGEPSIGCGPGTVLVDGVCVLEETPESDVEQEAAQEAETYTAPAPQSGGDTRADNRDLIFGAAGGFLAAGIIAVILALIYRANRRKH